VVDVTVDSSVISRQQAAKLLTLPRCRVEHTAAANGGLGTSMRARHRRKLTGDPGDCGV